MSPLTPTTTTTTQLTGTSAVPIPGPVIAYTRWIVPVPPAEGSKSAQKRGEALERAWRGVQSFNPDQDDIKGQIQAGEDEAIGGERERGEVQEGDEGEGEGDEREKGQEKDKEQGNGKEMGRRVYAVIRIGEDGVPGLVVFEVGVEGADVMELEGLQVTDKGTLDARKLVTCAAHGNDLECLGPSRGCDVKWTPGDSILHWDALAEAMVEGRAWKEGRRVYANQYECHLWPISNDRLALDVRDRRTILSEKAERKRAYLDPLGIPAIPLGDYRPSQAQHTELVHQFSTAFGTKSFDPFSTAMQILADLVDHLDGGSDHASRAIWGVYWLSTRTDLSAGEDIRKHPGRVIIWPQALCRGAPQRTIKEHDPAIPTPVSTSSPPALMQLATGLFDFYTTYTPPEETVNEITPETEGSDGPDGLDEEGEGSEAYDPSEPLGPSPSSLPGARRSSEAAGRGDGEGNGEGEAGSDIDDLFSAGSPSPPTAAKKALPVDGDGGTSPQGRDNAVDAAGDAGDTERNQPVDFNGDAGEPDMSMDIDENLYAQMREWEDFSGGIEGSIGDEGVGEGVQRGTGGGLLGTRTVGSDGAVGGMVTEDDFNFFDSPPPPPLPLGEVEAGEVGVSARQDIPVADDVGGMISGENDGGAARVGGPAETVGHDPIVPEDASADDRTAAAPSEPVLIDLPPRSLSLFPSLFSGFLSLH